MKVRERNIYKAEERSEVRDGGGGGAG